MVGKISLASFTNFWTINSFSSLYDEGAAKSLSSPEFPVDQYKGYLRLDINGPADLLNKDFVSLFFFMRNLNEKKLELRFKFSILSSDKKEVVLYQDKGFVSEESGYGSHHFINKENLMNTLKRVLLPSDKLTIVSKVTILEQTANVQFTECSIELENLFEHKDFADTTLLVGEKKIQVHKAILASKSPVFYAMFNHDTKEKNDHVVEIVDIDYNVVLELVRFIYTGNVKNFQNLSKDLLIAADKYSIDELKDMCENSIIQTLNLENAAEMFVFADLYNSIHLKLLVQILIDENLKEFIRTPGFLTYKKSHSSVMLQILCSSIEKPDESST